MKAYLLNDFQQYFQSTYHKPLKREQDLALRRNVHPRESCLRPPAMFNQLDNAGCRYSHPIEAWSQGIGEIEAVAGHALRCPSL